MIRELLKTDRRMELLVEPELPLDSPLYSQLLAFADAFAHFHKLVPEEAVGLYFAFLQRHLRNIKRFVASGRYPQELDGGVQEVPRIEYDLALILSTLISNHRYQIMEALVQTHLGFGETGVVVGCGPGIELELLRPHFAQITAYDPHMSPFCRAQHPDVDLRECLFVGQEKDIAAIFMIELLEHLPAPFALLELAAGSLRPEGLLILTTSTNDPQFDHLYNFREGEVDAWCHQRQ